MMESKVGIPLSLKKTNMNLSTSKNYLKKRRTTLVALTFWEELLTTAPIQQEFVLMNAGARMARKNEN